MVISFTMGAMGWPSAFVLLKPASVPSTPFLEPLAPSGIIGFRRRSLFGTPNGSSGMIGRIATMVSWSGLTRTVSFQPSSWGSVAMMLLSQATRLRTWTSYRWKWIGCVSTPLWVIFQIWVPSLATEIGVTSMPLGRAGDVASRISVAGFTYG